MPLSRDLSIEVESDVRCWYSDGEEGGNRWDLQGVDGEEAAEEGGLTGKIISGFVRVGDRGAIETRGTQRSWE